MSHIKRLLLYLTEGRGYRLKENFLSYLVSCLLLNSSFSSIFTSHTAAPSSLPPPLLTAPPGAIRTSASSGQDVANAMAAAMLSGLRPHDAHFPNFPLPPPGFPPPFPPQLPGGDFRPRMPHFHGPPPFPLLPGGPLDVPGMLPPHLEDRGIPMHELGLPGK